MCVSGSIFIYLFIDLVFHYPNGGLGNQQTWNNGNVRKHRAREDTDLPDIYTATTFPSL